MVEGKIGLPESQEGFGQSAENVGESRPYTPPEFTEPAVSSEPIPKPVAAEPISSNIEQGPDHQLNVDDLLNESDASPVDIQNALAEGIFKGMANQVEADTQPGEVKDAA